MNKFKFSILTASLMLAMAFTISCSSGGGGGGNDDNGNSTGNSGGLTSDNSQVYIRNNRCDEDESNFDSNDCYDKWNGSGTVVFRVECLDETGEYGDIDYDIDYHYYKINGGKIINGKISLDFPDISEIPKECVVNVGDSFKEVLEKGISISSPEAKIVSVDDDFEVISNGNTCKMESEGGKDINGKYEFSNGLINYFSKPVKVTGTILDSDQEVMYNINATAGWNMLYTYEVCEKSAGVEYCKYIVNTNLKAISLKPMWRVSCYDDEE